MSSKLVSPRRAIAIALKATAIIFIAAVPAGMLLGPGLAQHFDLDPDVAFWLVPTAGRASGGGYLTIVVCFLLAALFFRVSERVDS